MAKIPVTNISNVAQRGIPNTSAGPNTTADDFGAIGARQVDQIGRGLQEVGGTVFGIAERTQIAKNQATVRDAMNQSANEYRTFNLEQKKKTGKAAENALQESTTELERIKAGQVKTLNTQSQMEMFDRLYQNFEQGKKQGAAAQQARGIELWENETRVARRAVLSDDAVEARTQADRSEVAIAKLGQSVVDQYTPSIGAEAAEVRSVQEMSAARVKVARALLIGTGEGDGPVAARAYLENSQGQMNEAVRVELLAKAEAGAVEQSAEWMAGLYANIPLEDAKRQVVDNTPGEKKLQKRTFELLEQQNEIRKANEKKVYNEAVDLGYSELRLNPDRPVPTAWEPVDTNNYKVLQGKLINARNRGLQDIPRNDTVYNRVLELQASNNEADKLKYDTLDTKPLEPYLPKKDIDRIKENQIKRKAGDPVSDSELYRMVKDTYLRQGLDATAFKEKAGRDTKNIVNIMDIASERFGRLPTAEQNKEGMNTIIASLITDGTFRGQSGFLIATDFTRTSVNRAEWLRLVSKGDIDPKVSPLSIARPAGVSEAAKYDGVKDVWTDKSKSWTGAGEELP